MTNPKPNVTPKPKTTHSLKNNIYLKLGLILVLIMLLMIPTGMVKQLIRERENVQHSAISEVSGKWGNSQNLYGPYLSIPYDKYVKEYSRNDSLVKIVKIKEWIHILPEELKIDGNISPEKRYRGIYEVVVYDSKIDFSGKFSLAELIQFDIPLKDIHFEKASLNIGISDLKGIENQVSVNWDGKNHLFNSGVKTSHICSSGINSELELLKSFEQINNFDLSISLKGSQKLYFSPVGKTTDISLKSDWQTPSFGGAYLPDNREISEQGFTANWNILHLNRNYPQSWIGSRYNIESSLFGTDLLLPVDNYQKSFRVAKYAVLFIVLTFLVFFFLEILANTFIHPIQYLLVGFALVIFYSLLLAFSEHMIFNLAYLSAAVLTLVLISTYISSVLKSKQFGLMILGILMILYLFIFTIIQLEDFALLIGSLGLFFILALLMFFSRKIDWYNIKIGK